MPPRDKLGYLRSLCGEKGFGLEPLPGGRMYRLIWIEIGHAMRNGKRDSAGFSVDEAIRYLRQFDPPEPEP